MDNNFAEPEQMSLTIAAAVRMMAEGGLLLPAGETISMPDGDQTAKIWDSTLSGVPAVLAAASPDHHGCRFPANWHERYTVPAALPKLDSRADTPLCVRASGQGSPVSLLAALLVSACGTYAVREPGKPANSDKAYPERRWYFNAMHGFGRATGQELGQAAGNGFYPKSDVTEGAKFSYMTDREADARPSGQCWIPVRRVLETGDPDELSRLARSGGVRPADQLPFIGERLLDLWRAIHERRAVFLAVLPGWPEQSGSRELPDGADDAAHGDARGQAKARERMALLTGQLNQTVSAAFSTDDVREITLETPEAALLTAARAAAGLGITGARLNIGFLALAAHWIDRVQTGGGNTGIADAAFGFELLKTAAALEVCEVFTRNASGNLVTLTAVVDSIAFSGAELTYDSLRRALPPDAGFSLTPDMQSLPDMPFGTGAYLLLRVLDGPERACSGWTRQCLERIHQPSEFRPENIRGIFEDFADWVSRRDRLPNLYLAEAREVMARRDEPPEAWLKRPELEAEFRESNFVPRGMELDFGAFKHFYEKRRKVLEPELRKYFQP